MANEDPERLELVRRMQCCAPGCRATPCEAHHPRVGVVGVAQKGHDDTAIPLCTRCHRDLHALQGVFKTWDKHTLRDWQQDRIADTRENVEMLRSFAVAAGEDEEIPF